jgi:hypothetical protein
MQGPFFIFIFLPFHSQDDLFPHDIQSPSDYPELSMSSRLSKCLEKNTDRQFPTSRPYTQLKMWAP